MYFENRIKDVHKKTFLLNGGVNMDYVRLDLKSLFSVNKIITLFYFELSKTYFTPGEAHDFILNKEDAYRPRKFKSSQHCLKFIFQMLFLDRVYKALMNDRIRKPQ